MRENGITTRRQADDDFDGWLNGLIARWSIFRSASGRLSQASAEASAKRITSKLLPNSNHSEDQYILEILYDEKVVATFWLEVKAERAFLYDLSSLYGEVGEEFLSIVEEVARSLGASELRVNVYASDELLVRLTGAEPYLILNSQMWMMDDLEKSTPSNPSALAIRPMTDSEFLAYYEHECLLYAEEKVNAGNATPEEAMEQSLEEMEKLLPDGLHSEGHYMFVAEINEQRVGTVWIDVDLEAEVPRAFGLAVEISESLRGQGLGRAILLATLLECRKLGASGLGLSVFGHNFIARNLYVSLGFQVVEEMKKKIL